MEKTEWIILKLVEGILKHKTNNKLSGLKESGITHFIEVFDPKKLL